MKIFIYKSKRYTRIFPRPKIYNSQLVRDVTNRGSIFALNVDTGEFTIIPGDVKLETIEMFLRKAPLKNKENKKQLLLIGL